MAELVAEARRKLSRELDSIEPESLASLRLAAGLSQAQLAARVGTSQPHIARIEMGKTDPGTDLIARIAEALEQNASRIFAAVRTQRAGKVA
ncbi:MAG: helix-turn-helix domain-containing protein [Gammaproteobacteria bacterium]|nr:helix-turn-helix domain-containing protein [Gammaproteobacteria bacterium]